MNPTERPAPGQAPRDENDLLPALRSGAMLAEDRGMPGVATLFRWAAGEIERVRRERDRLIDGNMHVLGDGGPRPYVAFPDEPCEERFDSLELARLYVRKAFGLD